MKRIAFFLAILIGLAVLLGIPGSAGAQDNETQDNLSAVVASDGVSGTLEISPEAIQSLLDGEAAIPGGYRSYGSVIFWAFFFGSLGGLVYEMTRLHGNLELPHRYGDDDVPDDEEFRLAAYAVGKWSVDLGFLARMFVGGMAALAILLVISPEERLKFIATVVIAGSAGASIFETMRSRLVATLAVADAADLRAKSEQLDGKLKEIDALLLRIKAQASGVVPREPVGDEDADAGALVQPQMAVQMGAAPAANIALLDELERALSEAKGIRSTMDRR